MKSPFDQCDNVNMRVKGPSHWPFLAIATVTGYSFASEFVALEIEFHSGVRVATGACHSERQRENSFPV